MSSFHWIDERNDLMREKATVISHGYVEILLRMTSCSYYCKNELHRGHLLSFSY